MVVNLSQIELAEALVSALPELEHVPLKALLLVCARAIRGEGVVSEPRLNDVYPAFNSELRMKQAAEVVVMLTRSQGASCRTAHSERLAAERNRAPYRFDRLSENDLVALLREAENL